jgi:hypothetical protein
MRDLVLLLMKKALDAKTKATQGTTAVGENATGEGRVVALLRRVFEGARA